MTLLSSRTAIALLATMCACVTGGLLAGPTAHAQGWLEGRDRAEGPGFRVGNLELHPGLGAELGYDSNVFLSSDAAGVDPIETSPILRVTPHLFLSTLGPQRAGAVNSSDSLPVLDFRTGVSASVYHYFDTRAPSNVELKADALMTLLPQRPFSITILGAYGRTIRPFTEKGALGDNYARNQVDGGLKLNLQTRGGILRGSAGYTFSADIFEGDSFNFANSLAHKASVESSWRFLPSTALLYDGELNWQSYYSDKVGQVLLADQVRMRTRFGVNGYITNVVSVLAMLGYGAGFFDAGDDYDGIVAQAALNFAFSQAFSASLGYDRDFSRTFVGNFYRRDRGFVRMQLLAAGALLVTGEAGLGLYDFGQTFAPGGGSVGNTLTREDLRFDGNVFAEYRFTEWLAANARFEYVGNFTDYEFDRSTGGGPMLDPAKYNRWSVWGGLRVFY
jgi:hypothetical protein